ncbi:MAG: glycosyltransferase family 9 protein [Pontiella sp.]
MKKANVIPPSLQRVGVFMTDQHMGDFILAMPTIQALAAYFDNGIDLYVASQHAPLAELIPGVSRTIPYSHNKKTRKSPVQFFSFLKMVLRLPLQRYQATYFIRARITESTFAVMTLSPRRIATNTSSRKFVYNRIVKEPLTEKHETRKMACLLQTIGQTEPPEPIRLKAPTADAQRLETILFANHLKAGQKLAVIHPSAGLAHRCWPKDRFAYVADALIECGMKVCFIGAPNEYEFVKELKQHMEHPDDSFFLADKLTVLLALFERANILFSNESGPTHLASTTDLSIVTIFGPTPPERWKPMRTKNLTILSKKELCQCDDPRFCNVDWPCIKEITVEECLHALEEYI